MDLALNNIQRFICHKTNQPTIYNDKIETCPISIFVVYTHILGSNSVHNLTNSVCLSVTHNIENFGSVISDYIRILG